MTKYILLALLSIFAINNLQCKPIKNYNSDLIAQSKLADTTLEDDDDELDSITDDEDDIDSLEVEKDWTVSAMFKLQNKKIQNGLESSKRPSNNTSFTLEHSSGFTVLADVTRLMSPAEFSNYSIGLDYLYSLSETIDIGATINKTKYANDTVSAFAGSTGNMSIYADFNTKSGIYDISYDYYFGKDQIYFINLSYLNTFKFGDFKFQPIVSLSLGEYNILAKGLGVKIKTPASKQAFGLTSIVLMGKLKYYIGNGFDLAIAPTLNFSKSANGKKLTPASTIYASINYSYDF